MVERCSEKAEVAGSKPASGAKNKTCFVTVCRQRYGINFRTRSSIGSERQPTELKVAGSNPAVCTNNLGEL